MCDLENSQIPLFKGFHFCASWRALEFSAKLNPIKRRTYTYFWGWRGSWSSASARRSSLWHCHADWEATNLPLLDLENGQSPSVKKAKTIRTQAGLLVNSFPRFNSDCFRCHSRQTCERKRAEQSSQVWDKLFEMLQEAWKPQKKSPKTFLAFQESYGIHAKCTSNWLLMSCSSSLIPILEQQSKAETSSWLVFVLGLAAKLLCYLLRVGERRIGEWQGSKKL